MKKQALLFALALGMTTQAYSGTPIYTACYGALGCDVSRGPFGCAPEVVNGNLAAADQTLKALGASPEFKQAGKFKAKVQAISVLPAERKIGAYLALVDIQPNDTEAIAQFIGAREVPANLIINLERNVELNNHQSQLVVEGLQRSLRGQLN